MSAVNGVAQPESHRMEYILCRLDDIQKNLVSELAMLSKEIEQFIDDENSGARLARLYARTNRKMIVHCMFVSRLKMILHESPGNLESRRDDIELAIKDLELLTSTMR
ncbi:MAG: hypothetical protein KDK38_08185 [Leptospiraceae bacterium]|nr:hypothetical protein [Leptospiraceae bacterium]